MDSSEPDGDFLIGCEINGHTHSFIPGSGSMVKWMLANEQTFLYALMSTP
jgi:hypothetical protein